MTRETYNQVLAIPVEEIQVGTVLAPTDSRAIPWGKDPVTGNDVWQMVFNQDALPGPPNPGDADWIWLAMRTVQGSNGTKFVPLQYKTMPPGKPACWSVMLTADEQGQVFFKRVAEIPKKVEG